MTQEPGPQDGKEGGSSLTYLLAVPPQRLPAGNPVEHSGLHGGQELALDEALLQDQTAAEERRDREGNSPHEGGVWAPQRGSGEVRGSAQGAGGEDGVPAAGEERPAAPSAGGEAPGPLLALLPYPAHISHTPCTSPPRGSPSCALIGRGFWNQHFQRPPKRSLEGKGERTNLKTWTFHQGSTWIHSLIILQPWANDALSLSLNVLISRWEIEPPISLGCKYVKCWHQQTQFPPFDGGTRGRGPDKETSGSLPLCSHPPVLPSHCPKTLPLPILLRFFSAGEILELPSYSEGGACPSMYLPGQGPTHQTASPLYLALRNKTTWLMRKSAATS